MNENDIIQLLDTLREQSKNASVLLIKCTGKEITIAASSPDGATTASYSVTENSRMARNAMAGAILQMMITPITEHK